MKEKIQSITEGTVLPISLVIALVGGIVYINDTHSKAEGALGMAEQEMVLLQAIDRRLSHIEGFMEKQTGKNDE